MEHALDVWTYFSGWASLEGDAALSAQPNQVAQGMKGFPL